MREYLFGLATERINGAIHLIPKCVLLLLSLLYGIIVRVLIFLSGLQARRLSCKVISVGDITDADYFTGQAARLKTREKNQNPDYYSVEKRKQ